VEARSRSFHSLTLDYGSFYSFTRNVMTSNEIRQFLSSEPMK
jgi:hypothetical protein